MDKRIVILTKSDFIRDQLSGLRVVDELGQLQTNENETIIMVSYPEIIRTNHYPNWRFLNVHNSLLPKYRGLHAFTWALCHGENEVGFTLHHVVDKVDAGNIVAQLPIPVLPIEDINALFTKAWAFFFPWFKRQVEQFEIEGIPKGEPQLEKEATYFPKRKPEDSRIHWKDSAEAIHNLVRAVAPPYTPGAFFEWGGNRIQVAKSEVCKGTPKSNETGYLYRNQEHWQVVCGTDELRLLEWVEEGSGAVSALREGVILS